MVEELLVFKYTKLLPHLVKCSGPAAEEDVHADVEGVSLSRLGSAQAPGNGVHLEDRRLVAVHLGITPGRKPGNAGANDHHSLFHCLPLFGLAELTCNVLSMIIIQHKNI